MSMMEVQIPDIGDFKDVAVIEMLVKVGDTVKAEQSLFTVESDKASMEIPSPAAGTITALTLKIGDTVNVGDVVGQMSVQGAAAPAAQSARLRELEWQGRKQGVRSWSGHRHPCHGKKLRLMTFLSPACARSAPAHRQHDCSGTGLHPRTSDRFFRIFAFDYTQMILGLALLSLAALRGEVGVRTAEQAAAATARARRGRPPH
jgi:pyruvate/2-oxoglutarate dehydrogenase complex dihydrolipoamide acyltransferase (E2) component